MASSNKTATKKKRTTKKQAAEAEAEKQLNDALPTPVQCEGPFIVEVDGEEEEVYRLPETEIEIPANLKDMVYSLDAVTVDPSNPRQTQNLDVLVASIRRFGFRQPIIVNKRTMQIEAGHQRREALKGKLACNFAPMIFVSDSELKAAAFNVADNRTAEVVANWDEAALSRIYGVLREENALDGVGFDDESMIQTITQLRASDLEERQREKDNQNREQGKGGMFKKDLEREYTVTITCRDEQHQVEILEWLAEHNIDARAAII